MTNLLTVKNECVAIKLVVRSEFEKELPSLDADRYGKLKEMIRRDGILDSIKYRVSESGECEIIDGHHRYKIANELGIEYSIEEIKFKTPSITNVLYWMHVFNNARRGSKPNVKRMTALWIKLQAESGKVVSKTAAVKQTAKDVGKSEREMWRGLEEPKEKPSSFEYLAKMIAKALDQLTDSERERLVAMIIEKPGE